MQERTINTWRDPYGEGFSTCRPKKIAIQPGLTVLVGCNGAGKTTLLMNIEEELKKQGIPCHKYDNLRSGGNNAIGTYMWNDNFTFASLAMSSSEGENISLNLGNLVRNFKEFIETGRIETKSTRISDLFHEYERPKTNERWILLDAIDSGYSVDNVVDAKDVFRQMVSDAAKQGYDLNIVVSANEYEMAAGEQCLDVNSGKYVTFPKYEDYRKFILESRKKKDRRWERLRNKNKKPDATESEETIEKQ